MPLTDKQRDKITKRLIYDWVDTLTQWAIKGKRDELYNYVLEREAPNELGDEELIDNYQAAFGELPEGVEEEMDSIELQEAERMRKKFSPREED